MSSAVRDTRTPATLYQSDYQISKGFFSAVILEPTSSESASPAHPDDAELFREAPLYPPLRDSDPYRYNDYLNIHTDNEHDTYTKQSKYFYKTVDTDKSDVEIRDIERTDFKYDDPETSAEDGGISVTPDDPDVSASITIDRYSEELNYLTPENEYQRQNPFSIKTNNFVKPDILTSNPQSRFIISPGSNAKEVNDLLDEKMKLQNVRNVQSSNLNSKDDDDEDVRRKRSSDEEDHYKVPRRVKTGVTILNIDGDVRDAIGDPGAASGSLASSHVDSFVIRPAPVMKNEPRDKAREEDARREREPATTPPPKLEHELVVEAQSPARIVCDLPATHNVTDLRWHKDTEVVSLERTSGALAVEAPYLSDGAVVIPRAGRQHAALWRCTGRDHGGDTVAGLPTRLLIYEAVRSVYLAIDGRRLDAGNTWVPVSDKSELEVQCVAEGGVPPPELVWQLVPLEPSLDYRPYLEVNSTDHSIDPPSFVISRWPGFGVNLMAGSGATLRCDVDSNPPSRAMWTRDSSLDQLYPERCSHTHTHLPSSRVELQYSWYRWSQLALARGEQRRVGHAPLVAAVDGGRWLVPVPCHLARDTVLIHRVLPQLEEPEHQEVEVNLGGNVQLHCPKGSVGCWWRRVASNTSDNWAPAGSHHAHGVLGISEAMWEEDGEYRCLGTRSSERERLRELKRVTLSVSGGATARVLRVEETGAEWRLTCSVCGRDVRAYWLWPASGLSQPAELTADETQHCWHASHVTHDPDEAWCVAVTPAGGAVAMFPARASDPTRSPELHPGNASATNLARPPLPVLLFGPA
ncbi:unnamed protein product, partial [Leptidea sinapis]